MALSTRRLQWTQQLLQQDDNIHGETFEWNITQIVKNTRRFIESPPILWGEYTCSLNIYGAMSGNMYNVHLQSKDSTFLKNVKFYELSLINPQRQNFLSVSGNKLPDSNFGIHLMTFCANHYINSSEESLILCLSLNTLTNKVSCEKETQTTPDQFSEKGQLKFLQSLSNDFGRFYDSKTNADCVLRVGKVLFPAHRAVLSARSTVFADLFHHGTTESISGMVNILQVDEAVIRDVLYFIYTGQIRGLTTESAALMYAVAQRFGLNDLKLECRDFLKHSLKISNVCDAALLAHDYGEIELEEEVVQFMKYRLEEIKESVDWKILCYYKPLLTSKLYRSIFTSCKDKYNNLA